MGEGKEPEKDLESLVSLEVGWHMARKGRVMDTRGSVWYVEAEMSDTPSKRILFWNGLLGQTVLLCKGSLGQPGGPLLVHLSSAHPTSSGVSTAPPAWVTSHLLAEAF